MGSSVMKTSRSEGSLQPYFYVLVSMSLPLNHLPKSAICTKSSTYINSYHYCKIHKTKKCNHKPETDFVLIFQIKFSKTDHCAAVMRLSTKQEKMRKQNSAVECPAWFRVQSQ